MATVDVERSRGGARIYRIPMELFPGFQGFAHLVCQGEARILFDVGSGFGNAAAELEAGLESVRRDHGEQAGWQDLTAVVISHGHIDHFGGLGYVRRRTRAPIAVHGLDLQVLTNYQQRLAVVALRLSMFLAEAGVDEAGRRELMDLYLLNKGLYSAQAVDRTLESAAMQIGPLSFLHVPGHCPGQVVARIDDVLLSSDHVLPHTSPHQSPEALSLYTGLGHYLESLEKIARWAGGIRCALGGHEAPFDDLPGRVDQIRQVHVERLGRVLDLFEVSMTVAEVSAALFPEVGGYDALLALEEAGAHVEYLADRGYLSIANLDELESTSPVPIRYCRLGDLSACHVRLTATLGAGGGPAPV